MKKEAKYKVKQDKSRKKLHNHVTNPNVSKITHNVRNKMRKKLNLELTKPQFSITMPLIQFFF